MLDVALTLAAGGWPVFPCGPDKAPLVSGGFKARSRDPDKIRKWWGTRPESLPAIVPGDQGLAALDIDSTKAAEAADKAGYFQSEPRPFLVQTAGTSQPFTYQGAEYAPMHLYLYATEQPEIPGVVVRFNAGYVIAPGARREGRLYHVSSTAEPMHWDRHFYGVSLVEEALSQSKTLDFDRVKAAVLTVPNSDDVGREQYVGMAHMIRGALGDEGKELFLEWAGRYPGANPDEDARVWDTLPPSKIGWRELWALASSFGFDAQPEVQDEARNTFTTLAPEVFMASDAEGTPRERLLAALKIVRDAKDIFDQELALRALRKWGFGAHSIQQMLISLDPEHGMHDDVFTLEELLQHPELMQLPPAAIPYLAWPGIKTLLASREKGGKSTLAMAGVSAATRGADFLGEAASPQNVLYLTEEPTPIIANRAVQFKCNPKHLMILNMGMHPAAQLKRALDRRPQIIVIDTLYRFSGLLSDEENDAGAWLPMLMQFDEITKAGVALLILAHSAKNDPHGGYRGSTAIGGGVDAVYSLTTPAGSPRTRRIFGKGRLSYGQPFSVQLMPDGIAFGLVADVQAKKGDREAQKMIELLQEYPSQSIDALEGLMHAGNKKVKSLLLRLEAEGFVRQGKEEGEDPKRWYATQAKETFDAAEPEQS